MVWFAIAALGYVIAVKDHNWFRFSRTAATLPHDDVDELDDDDPTSTRAMVTTSI